MNPTLERQREEYRSFLDSLNTRREAGEQISSTDMDKARSMKADIEAAEARAVDDSFLEAELDSAARHAAQVQAQSAETRAKIGEAAGRDIAGEARKRDGEEMVNLRQIAIEGRFSESVRMNYGAARNLKALIRMGVTPEDVGDALRHGEILMAERSAKSGQPDARAYAASTGAAGAIVGSASPVVPTLTATMLYDYMEFVGGVRASGAEVYPTPPLTQTEFPVVTVHEETANLNVAEGVDGPESDDTLDEITLTPEPFRGIAIVSKAMLQADVVGFSAFIGRALGRAVGRNMERTFHNKAVAGGQQFGILVGQPDTNNATNRTINTGGNNTEPTVEHYGAAMGLLDAGYHGAGDSVSMMNGLDMRSAGVRWLMSSNWWFPKIVTNTATDGHFQYPEAMRSGTHIGRPVGFSSFMASAAAANAILAIVGNFYDGYLIAEDGMVEISFDTSVEFKSSRIVYKGEAHAQGAVRDNRALAWIESSA